MRFFDTTVYLPVGMYRMAVTTEEPRIPTAFEWQIAKIVDELQKMEVHTDVTVIDIFREVLGCNGVEPFVKTALQELFSSTVNVFRTKNHRVPFEELHISEIEVTKEGRLLLQSKKLPSAPRTEERKVYFDYARNAIVPEGRWGTRIDFAESYAKLLLSLVEGVAAPIEQQREIEERGLSHDSRIREIVPIQGDHMQYFWRRQPVSFSIENGKITLDPFQRDPKDGTEQYLRNLTPEIARQVFFTEQFSDDGLVPSGEVVDMPKNLISITPVPKIASASVPNVPITFRQESAPSGIVRPTLLDVILRPELDGGPEFEVIDAETCFSRLVLSGDSYGLSGWSVSDRSTIYTLARVRCFYDGMPLELPVSIMTRQDPALSERQNVAIARALQKVSGHERYVIGYLMAAKPDDREKQLTHIRTGEGAAASEIVNKIILTAKARGMGSVEGMILNDLFSKQAYDDLKDVEADLKLINEIDVTSSARAPYIEKMRSAMRRFRPETMKLWADATMLKSKLGLRWTFNEHDPLMAFLFSPAVSATDIELAKKTISLAGTDGAWFDVCKEVLKNHGEKLPPVEYVKKATTLSLGDTLSFSRMMQWFVDFSDWQNGFRTEDERNDFFARHSLPLPVKKKPMEVPPKRRPASTTKQSGEKESAHLVPQTSLIIIDGSNLVGFDDGLRTRALEAVLKALASNGYQYRVFFDKSIFSWLKRLRDQRGIDFINDGVNNGSFIIAPSRTEADGQILQLADNEDGEPHVISYDDYKDRADIYPWVLNRKGDSRVHAWNFIQTAKGVRILIADFNLDIVIPNAKLTRRYEGGRK